ncbi:Arylsulfatase [Roseimaritima multifibrata]|uniref:Arylsulfatase n=1 Tax=Roseimaritima multifibrata TaxID=1930274 RepID=A0A517MKU0_9BACT|nr:arylsulfatase [Roseimaritima multifibrata]QDS95502.1 Arylsulfatase [Roseimaritima multifibrata]
MIWSCLLLLAPAPVAVAAKPVAPNIIVIYTDDQGFGDVRYLNPKAKFKTPNMDRIAAEGIAFTNAHSSDSVCTPSRYGLLTGRYSWRTTMKQGVMGAEGKCLIPDQRMTLASLLRDSGYDTAMVGKWHLGMDFPGTPEDRDWSLPVQDMPLDKGFDHFYGIPASLNYGILAWFEGRHAAVPPQLWTAKKPNARHSDYRIMPPYQATAAETRQTLGKPGFEVAADFIDNQCLTRFTDKAIAWLDQTTQPTGETAPQDSESRKPFFLYLPFTSPHYPVCPLPEFWGQGECGGYGEFVIETDHHIGRILDYLDQKNLTEETLVILTSDNGPENSWKGRIKQFQHHSNGPYRGGKRDIYEGGHRVPMLIRWPAGISNPGRTCDDLVGQIDLLATVAELIGTPLPANAGEDSHSFASILTDPDKPHARVPLINHGVSGRFAITDKNWKLVQASKPNGQVELYDLASDEGETKNLIDSHPQVAEQLQEKLNRIICQGRSTAGPAQANDTGYWNHLHWMSAQQYDLLSLPESQR